MKCLPFFWCCTATPRGRLEEESGDVSYPCGLNKEKLTLSDTGLRLDVQTHAQPDRNSNLIPVRAQPGVALQDTLVLPAKAVMLRREIVESNACIFVFETGLVVIILNSESNLTLP